MHYITLHCITIHISLHYITFITLHYITYTQDGIPRLFTEVMWHSRSHMSTGWNISPSAQTMKKHRFRSVQTWALQYAITLIYTYDIYTGVYMHIPHFFHHMNEQRFGNLLFVGLLSSGKTPPEKPSPPSIETVEIRRRRGAAGRLVA